MKLEMLALYDAKVGAYMTPFFAQSIGAAVRSLSDLVNGGGDEAPKLHPEDFTLWKLATWFDDGVLTVEQAPVEVAKCMNLKREV